MTSPRTHLHSVRFAASLGLGLGLVALLAACGSTSDASAPPPAATTDVADAGPVTPPVMPVDAAPPLPYPAFPSTAAQLVTRGGKILKAPKLALLTYTGDPMTTTATSFVSAVGTSSYWSAATKEYGVGPAAALAPVTLTDPAPATIEQAEIETWLAGQLDGTHADVPVPDGETLYVIVYPAGTTVTRGARSSCKEFGGFHAEASRGTGVTPASVPYVVLPRCSTFSGLSGKDLFTFALSHELVEATLDPFTTTGPAYDFVDPQHEALALVLGGGEAGDICPDDSALVTGLPFLVQRTWSNASAKAGHHPCVPLDPLPYFLANPVLGDLSPDAVPVVKIPLGQSRTIDVQLASDAPMPADWTVTAVDSGTVRGKPVELTFALDRTTGNNGDVLHLTITTQRAGSFGKSGGYSVFVLHSVSKDKRFTNIAGIVQN